jgi:hypothetical protein
LEDYGRILGQFIRVPTSPLITLNDVNMHALRNKIANIKGARSGTNLFVSHSKKLKSKRKEKIKTKSLLIFVNRK